MRELAKSMAFSTAGTGPESQGAWLKSSMTEACQSKGKKMGHQAGGATRIQHKRWEPDPEPWQVKDAEVQG